MSMINHASDLSDTLRKRMPFRHVSDDTMDEDENHIMDEEEQENLIESLRGQGQQANKLNSLLMRLMLGASGALHLLFLVTGDPDPISRLDLFTATPHSLPLGQLFTLLHLVIHLNAAQHLIPPRFTIRDFILRTQYHVLARYIPLRYSTSMIISGAAPVISLLSGRGTAVTIWWSLTGVMIGLCWLFHNWEQESKESLRELEGMKYTAKGA